jgi:hypothetical protein
MNESRLFIFVTLHKCSCEQWYVIFIFMIQILQHDF